MTDDFSSMSSGEKRGYLKALGIDPGDPEGEPPEENLEPRAAEVETVVVEKWGFSSEEIALLQRKSARVWGSLSVAFHGVLRAAFVGVEVDEELSVKIRPRTGSKPLNPLSVREAIKAGLEPHL